MKKNQQKIIILGAGLTGLTIAYLLEKSGISPTILEARDRLGGRIHSVCQTDEAPIELGATWLGKRHIFLMNLLKELKLNIFDQALGNSAIFEAISTSPPQLVNLPPNADPSFRIEGGSSSLIERLATHLKEENQKLGQTVKEVRFENNLFQITSNQTRFEADILISTLPPNLLVNTIDFFPALPTDLIQISENTHTWMGESIKVALRFKSPFWRAKNLSGTIFSNVGPISEMYDHANVEDSHFALKGFLNGGLYGATKAERLNLILKQLHKYFGAQVEEYLSYEECVWRLEKFSFIDYKQYILPHQNNGHATLLKPYYDGGFFITGAETSQEFGGYMEGAIRSAYRVVEQLKSRI